MRYFTSYFMSKANILLCHFGELQLPVLVRVEDLELKNKYCVRKLQAISHLFLLTIYFSLSSLWHNVAKTDVKVRILFSFSCPNLARSTLKAEIRVSAESKSFPPHLLCGKKKKKIAKTSRSFSELGPKKSPDFREK